MGMSQMVLKSLIAYSLCFTTSSANASEQYMELSALSIHLLWLAPVVIVIITLVSFVDRLFFSKKK